MRASLRSWLPTDAWTWALLAPALVFIATAIDRNLLTDFWHHLARGQVMAEQGRLLDEDRFTYTVPGKPLQDVNWLTQLLYHHLFRVGGLELVQTVNSLTLAVMMTLLVALCRRKCGSLLAAGLVGVFTFFGLWQLLIIRPQTFSLLLFVLLYTFLERSDRDRRLLLVPPLLMALWANLHGGFPIGLILAGGYALAALVEGIWKERAGVVRDRKVRAFCLCFAACVVATLANPYGWKVYQYVGGISTSAVVRHLDEWLPPGLDTLTGKVFVASLLLVVVSFALPRRRPTVREVCLLACFLPLACGSVRMVAWWLLVSAPVVAVQLAAHLPRPATETAERDNPSWGAAALVAALLAACAVSVPGMERYNPVFGRLRSNHRPEHDLRAITEQLPKEGATGRVFTRFEWGEYLGWKLAPAYTVFMDGRIEIFPGEVWQQYDAVTRGRGDWGEVLRQYEVNHLILDRAGYHAGLLPHVERSPEWERVCEQGSAVLFARRRS